MPVLPPEKLGMDCNSLSANLFRKNPVFPPEKMSFTEKTNQMTELETLQEEVNRLRHENAELRQQCGSPALDYLVTPQLLEPELMLQSQLPELTNKSSVQEKIALFRSLFLLRLLHPASGVRARL